MDEPSPRELGEGRHRLCIVTRQALPEARLIRDQSTCDSFFRTLARKCRRRVSDTVSRLCSASQSAAERVNVLWR